MKETEQIIERIFQLFEDFGHESYVGDEEVTQLQHAQQCADQARNSGQASHVILGAFLHDIGHLIGLEKGLECMMANGKSLGTKTHEKVGEEFLKSLGFPNSVTDFVRGHVEAKRYLVFKDPSYHDKLSLASQGTLINQGGPMSAEEALLFERHPDFKALIQMRQWDDKAKNKTIPVSANDSYKELCRDILLDKTV